jgi:hyperosmotically inducible protein
VQLSGFVSSWGAMNKAVEVTRGVAGVTSVKNDMQLK